MILDIFVMVLETTQHRVFVMSTMHLSRSALNIYFGESNFRNDIQLMNNTSGHMQEYLYNIIFCISS